MSAPNSQLSHSKLNRRVAVVLHLYYQDLWAEFATAIDSLRGKCDFDLYITLCQGAAHKDQTRWLRRKILERFPVTVILELANKGTDNGPFLNCLELIRNLKQDYDYLIKLHTKKSLLGSSEMWLAKVWRQELIQPILGSPQAVENCLRIFENDPLIGMLGAKKHITNHISTNGKLVTQYQKRWQIPKMGLFVGGNMFWAKYSIFKNLLRDVDIPAAYSELETGYVTDRQQGTRTHALERIWGYAVTNAGLQLKGV